MDHDQAAELLREYRAFRDEQRRRADDRLWWMAAHIIHHGDLRQREVAEILGVTRETVRVRTLPFLRALRMLRGVAK